MHSEHSKASVRHKDPSGVIKIGIKLPEIEIKEEDVGGSFRLARSDAIKDEGEIETTQEVSTRERIDTPSGIGLDVGVRSQDSMFAFSMVHGSAGSTEEDRDDRGYSDGEGGSFPYTVPKRPAVLTR